MSTENDTVFEIEQEEGFALTYHSLSRHKSLSMPAIALLIYLLSHNQEKYKIKIATVLNHFKGRCGKDKIYKLIHECIATGYISRQEIREGNRYSGWLYRVAGKPKFKKCLPHPDFQDASGQLPENKDHKEYQESKDSKEYQDKEISPVAPAVAAAPAISLSSRKKITEVKEEVTDFVWLTKTQQQKLLKRVDNNSEKLKKCYIKLSDWKIGKSISGGKNDYSAILNWVLDAVEKSESVPTEIPLTERNKIFSQKVKSLHKNNPDVIVGPTYIQITSGPMHSIYEKFESKDLKKIVLHELTKKRLSIQGLND